MSETVQTTSKIGWRTWLLLRVAELRQREGQIFLALALVIGALTGLAVVAFIMSECITGRGQHSVPSNHGTTFLVRSRKPEHY
jgi:hypothetical protein